MFFGMYTNRYVLDASKLTIVTHQLDFKWMVRLDFWNISTQSLHKMLHTTKLPPGATFYGAGATFGGISETTKTNKTMILSLP